VLSEPKQCLFDTEFKHCVTAPCDDHSCNCAQLSWPRYYCYYYHQHHQSRWTPNTLAHKYVPSFDVARIYLYRLFHCRFIKRCYRCSVYKRELKVIVNSQLECSLGKKPRLVTVNSQPGSGSLEPTFRKNGSGIVLNWPQRWSSLLKIEGIATPGGAAVFRRTLYYSLVPA